MRSHSGTPIAGASLAGAIHEFERDAGFLPKLSIPRKTKGRKEIVKVPPSSSWAYGPL